MRWLIWFLLLCALATGLTLLAQMNTGYVLVTIPGRRLELSLNFALVLALSGFVAFYLLVRLLVTMVELPGRVRRLRETRRVKKAQDTLIEALQDYFAGRYGRAENAARRAMELGAPVHVGAVIAARAAHELHAPERRDAYLARLVFDPAKPDAVKAVSEARILLDERRPEEALAALATLPKKHTAALRLELRARQRAGQWEFVPALIDQLEKRDVFSGERADAERRHAYSQWIERKAADADLLKEVWRRVPERYRKDTAVAAAAASAFHAFGLCAEAQAIIERSLDVEWDSGLVNLYGECGAPETVRQIERAERWLKDHRQDGTLLLALGRLCAQRQLWGKAQSYLEASLSIEPTYSAHLELARLYDRIERADDARRHYRASLELAVGLLSRMSGGRQRRTN